MKIKAIKGVGNKVVELETIVKYLEKKCSDMEMYNKFLSDGLLTSYKVLKAWESSKDEKMLIGYLEALDKSGMFKDEGKKDGE